MTFPASSIALSILGIDFYSRQDCDSIRAFENVLGSLHSQPDCLTKYTILSLKRKEGKSGGV